MGKIKILDKQTAELIAAGEVVENPASVVKELIENAVDAGATSVTVEIKNGGKSYIRITDNGSGMSPEDAKNAFIRHATSKIERAEDLFHIHTMGFRGEALASIAAVSKTELFTKEKGLTDGTHIVFEGGELTADEPCGTPDGTTIVVRDLFYNTPARLNFLKKESTEGAYVTTVIERQALATPEISVRFIKDGREQLFTSGDGQLKSAVYCVFGREFEAGLIPLDYSEDGMTAKGFISKPLSSKANRNMQVFFVNDRNIRSRTLSTALEEGYKNTLMTGKFPACVVNISLEPSKVDVNVHPRKTEVKFSDEALIYGFLYRAVKNALEGDSGKQEFLIETPRTANFNRFPTINPAPVPQQTFTPQPVTAERPAPVPAPAPAKKQVPAPVKEPLDFFAVKEEVSAPPAVLNNETVTVAGGDVVIPWSIISDIKKEPEIAAPITEKVIFEETLTEKPEEKQVEKPEEQIKIETEHRDFQNPYHVVGELFSTYLIAENDTEAILIDKHAAHERILFEELKKNGQGFERQQLLTPLVLTLSKIDCDVLITNKEKLLELGFVIDEFGSGTVLVREVPEILEFSDAEGILSEISGILRRGGEKFEVKALDDILHTIACKSAVKAGSFTSDLEKEEFLKKLMSIENIKYCPHGRPVIVELTKGKLEKMFKRIL